jgi:hypothetical protein
LYRDGGKTTFFGPVEKRSIVKECNPLMEKSGACAASQQVPEKEEQVPDLLKLLRDLLHFLRDVL